MDKIDVGMGYEIATKWEPRLQYWMDGLEEWHLSTNGEDLGLADGLTYRRKLPILTNHPEAIPLEPGEVLQVGERYLTRDGQAMGPLIAYTDNPHYPYMCPTIGRVWTKDGSWGVDKLARQLDIIARLPKVVKEAEKAEKAKEEKVSGLKIQDKLINWPGFDAPGADTYIPLSEAARIAQLPEVQAEVKRQEEAKRIGPGDWAFDKIRQCVFEVKKVGRHQVVGIEMAFSDDACEEAHELSECRKLNLSTELIAALNAEIDGKAGG